VREELARSALEWIVMNPAAGMVSVAQDDWQGACQCEKCQAIVDEEGSQSGPVIRFVNAVAEEMEKQYPDFLVDMLAYSGTRTPPGLVHPRRNVVVRLCTSGCSKAQALATGDRNDLPGGEPQPGGRRPRGPVSHGEGALNAGRVCRTPRSGGRSRTWERSPGRDGAALARF
jgi:hypothetical protein